MRLSGSFIRVLVRSACTNGTVWSDYFAFDPADDVTFAPRTAVGAATVRIFGINDTDRVFERGILRNAGRYSG